MQSEDGQCLSPEPACGQSSESAGREDELDFEGDFAAGGEEDGSVRQNDKEGEEGEDGEVAESGPSDTSDLEEGELKEDEDDVAGAATDVCKYYPRGSCTWGSECRFSHQSGQCRPCRKLSSDTNSSAGQTGLRRHIPPLQPPVAVPAAFAARPPLLGLKPARPFFPVLPLPLPAPTDPMASNWERGLRSAKERLAKAKERKESESDFDDKRLNLTVPDEAAAHRYTQSARHAYPGRESGSYSSREHRSPASEQRSSYHSSGSHHYTSSYHSQPRDYRHGHYSHQSHDESEYERRQRLAYQSAPRPEEWNDRGRPRPPAQYPLLDRYGREIQRCSRPDDYVDKWKRSPVVKVERPVRESGDLSSISTSDSPSGLSGTSDSDSDGSWSDDDKDRKRVNHRTKEKKASAPVVNPELQPPSTSGMKRIPRLSERRDRASPKRTFKSELPRPDAAFSSKDKAAGVRDGDRSFRSSLSDSAGEAEFDESKAGKRKAVAAPPYESKRLRDSHSNGSRSPLSRQSATPEKSSGDSTSPSPKREKERFVMDFVGKVTNG